MYIAAGDTGLEIAPGKDVDDNPALKEIGNIWNTVPTARHWTPLDPIDGAITVNIGDGLQWWTVLRALFSPLVPALRTFQL